jgi:cbb3-type cytochrome oxidase maturation protein
MRHVFALCSRGRRAEMNVIYGLIPGMLMLGLIAVGIFFWAARSGQFDDMEGEASRILMDEDLRPAVREPEQESEGSDKEPS